MEEESGTTGVVDGLGRINGRWCVIIGFDNKVMAGAWIAGQADNILRVTDIAKRLHCPLVWLVNCSRRKTAGAGEGLRQPPGQRHHLLQARRAEQAGHPRARGHLRHEPGRRRLPGHQPHPAPRPQGLQHRRGRRGHRERHGAQGLLRRGHGRADHRGHQGTSSRCRRAGWTIHYDSTGFFKQVFQTEEAILDAVKEWVAYLPAYDSKFFRVAEPAEPAFPAEDLYTRRGLQPEDDLRLRPVPRQAGGRQRAHGVPARLRPGALHGPRQGRRLPHRRRRATNRACCPGAIPKYAAVSGHRRQVLPGRAHQGERVRHPLRQGPGAHALDPGHDGHRRRRHR